MIDLPLPTRPAAVAGSFYPDRPQALRDALDRHLAAARSDRPADAADERRRPPKLLVVPHAGYVYSGDVAALAYARLARWRGLIRRVVLLGPVHRVAVRGLAAPRVGAFETPLGRVPLDQPALAALDRWPQVVRSDRPHALEHSLEVQLPFLQQVLGDGFTLVPLAVGDARPDEVDAVLESLWGGDETLIVVSTDLSHYLPYAQAQQRDRATVQRIVDFAADLVGEQACGAAPLNGALLTARRHGLQPRLLGLRNSADARAIANPDRGRVVGYAALLFEPADATTGEDRAGADGSGVDAALAAPDAALGRALVAAARQSIAEALGLPVDPAPAHPALDAPGATFVTLHGADGRLRGCIGRLEPTRPLGEDVRANARSAAFDDSRFEPLQAAEWPGLQVEVSLLEPLLPLPARSAAEAAAALQRGVDGAVLDTSRGRGVLLPQVWEQVPDGAAFVAALQRKAGLRAGEWPADARISRLRVRRFGAAPSAAGADR